MAFTGYKALDFSGIDKAIQGFQQRQQLASLGQNLDGTPEGYAKAAQALLQRGDTAAAANFFALGEKARERTSTLENDNRIFQGLGLSGGGAMGAPRPPTAQGVAPLASLGTPTAPAQREFNRPVQVAETEEDTQRLEAEMAQREGFGYGNPTLPAGMRNNNPGNIKFVSPRQAPGVVGPSVNTDQGDPQAVFNSPEAGMAAAYSLAMRKYQGGKRTALDLIAGQNGWTPGNTAAAANIARGMGVAPNEDLRLDDPQRAQAFMRSLIAQEHGQSGAKYPPELIRSAIAGPAGQPQPAQVAQAAPPAGQRGVAPIPGDNPIQLRQEAQAYAQTNPEAARQMIARADAIEQAAGVQTAQAGVPDPAMPAPGASLAQGFIIPGTGEVVPVETIANNPRLRNLAAAIPFVKDPAKRAGLENMFKLELEATKERMGAETRELDKEGKRLSNLKLARELGGEGGRPMTPDERKAYNVAPNQPAFMTAKNEPKFGPVGTTIVNEAQKLQSAEDKARVDTNTKFIGKLADSGPQVSQRMADMDVLASVIRDAPDTPTADVQVFFDRIGAGLGFSKGELATRSDAMKAIIQRLAPAQREEGSGSTSDIEFKGMLASFPSLATTKEGRQMILTTIARQNELTRMRIEVANEWAQGDIPATEARKKIAQIDRSSIYASEDEKKLIRKLAGTAKGGDLGRAAPAMEREVGGQIYVQRDGQWYPKGAN